MNTVVLVGRLTRDPELRRINNGTAVCSFSLAVNRRYKTPGQPEADFPYCTAWGKTAELLCQYKRKGALIGVTGRIQTHSYDDQHGQRQFRTDVVAENIEFLDSRSSGQGYGNGYGDTGGYPDMGYQDNGGFDGGYSQQGGYNNGYNRSSSYNASGNGAYGTYNNNYNQGYSASQNAYSNNGNSYSAGNGAPAYTNPADAGTAASNPAASPQYQNKAAAAASDMENAGLDGAFDDNDDLDISRDDLPF